MILEYTAIGKPTISERPGILKIYTLKYTDQTVRLFFSFINIIIIKILLQKGVGGLLQ